MSDFNNEEITELYIQNSINELLKFKDKIQLSENKVYKNEITESDLLKIAKLLFEIGQQPEQELRDRVENFIENRVQYLESFSPGYLPTQEEIITIMYSKVSDDLMVENILEGILSNYLSNPYSFILPYAITNAEDFLSDNHNNIEKGIKSLINEAPKYNNDFEFVDQLKESNLLSNHKYTVAYFILQHIFISIKERDEVNSLHYFLQDVFTLYATPIYNNLLYIIEEYSDLSLYHMLNR